MSSTEIVPLGTGSAVPTQGRSFSSVAVVRPEETLLFDCGEGTQARLIDSRIRFSRIKSIFLTHLHGDHIFGLPGLLSTMSLLQRGQAMRVVGPIGIQRIVETMPGLGPGQTSFDIDFIQLDDNDRRIVVHETDSYRVFARSVDHGVPAYGYRYEESTKQGNLDVERARSMGVTRFEDFRRLKTGDSVVGDGGNVVRSEEVVGASSPGGVFAYVGDTRPCEGSLDLAKGADILYHEATFAADLTQRAAETGHSTAVDAARIARRARVGRLLLSHFSSRYSDIGMLIEEARSDFLDTEAAVELQRYALQRSETEEADQ
ncbi:MAG: ribonuclease Z [Rhodothermales bacterium]|nr:ribonuclease Z [Rhodothermales bacterium]